MTEKIAPMDCRAPVRCRHLDSSPVNWERHDHCRIGEPMNGSCLRKEPQPMPYYPNTLPLA